MLAENKNVTRFKEDLPKILFGAFQQEIHDEKIEDAMETLEHFKWIYGEHELLDNMNRTMFSILKSQVERNIYTSSMALAWRLNKTISNENDKKQFLKFIQKVVSEPDKLLGSVFDGFFEILKGHGMVEKNDVILEVEKGDLPSSVSHKRKGIRLKKEESEEL